MPSAVSLAPRDSAAAAPAPKRARYWGKDQGLLDAVQHGTIEQVQEVIASGAAAKVIMEPAGQNLVFVAAVRPPSTDKRMSALAIVQLLVERHSVDCAIVDKLMAQTPLFYAAREGDVTMCAYLIQHRCQVDHIDVNAQTPLFYATRQGHVACAGLLLEQRSNINRADRQGQTALFYASKGSPSVVRFLLEQRADVCHRDRTAATPLFRASPACATALLDAEANVQCRDTLGRTALFSAADVGDLALLKLLHGRGCSVGTADVGGATCLFNAAKSGHVEACRLLLQLGAYASHVDLQNHNARHYAMSAKKMDIVTLIDQLPEENESNASGPSSVGTARSELLKRLFTAVASGTVEEVRAALVAVRDPRTVIMSNGQTLLHHAAARLNDAMEVCRLLVKYRVDPMVADSQRQQTALFFAVRAFRGIDASDASCARFLLSLRCDADAKDSLEQTPLFYGAQRQCDSCIVELLQARANPCHVDYQNETALHFAVLASSLECARTLLDARADPNVASTKGRTPLFVSIGAKEPRRLIRLLAESKCNANATDSAGMSAMALAASRGFDEALRALVAGGGDVNAVDTFGESALFHAARGLVAGADNREKMCQLLVELGADRSHRNSHGQTAADFFVDSQILRPKDSKVLRPSSKEAPVKRADKTSSVPASFASSRDVLSEGRSRRAVPYNEPEEEPPEESEGLRTALTAEPTPSLTRHRKYRLVFDDPRAPGLTLKPGSPEYLKACEELADHLPFLKGWFNRD